MNMSLNDKYKNYKFNYNGLNKINKYINILFNSFLANSFIREHSGHLNKTNSEDILRVIVDLLIGADKLLSDNNEAGFVAVASMAHEYILKFALIFSNYKKGKSDEKTLESLFHEWQNISLYKLHTKIYENIDKNILDIYSKKINTKIMNDFKHLNDISVIHFHNALISGDGENIDGKGFYVDGNAYHFIVMGEMQVVLDLMLLSIYTNRPEQLTSSDYIDHLELEINPPKNMQYIAAPWFQEYVKENLLELHDLILDNEYLACYEKDT